MMLNRDGTAVEAAEGRFTPSFGPAAGMHCTGSPRTAVTGTHRNKQAPALRPGGEPVYTSCQGETQVPAPYTSGTKNP